MRNVLVPERTVVAAGILGLIGSIFVFKYAGRYASIMEIGALLYFVVFISAIRFLVFVQEKRKLRVTPTTYLIILLSISAAAMVAVIVLPEKSGVSRLPALSAWLHRFLNGEFPYQDPSNPSGFPVLFFLALPFYYLGNLGFIEALGILVFGLAILKLGRPGAQTASTQLIVLLLLPTTYYEIVTRSELFFNMSIILALIIIARDLLDVRKVDIRFIGLAVLFGLALSTRSVVGLVYAMFVAFRFGKENVRNGFLFSLMVIGVFGLTLVPFMVWDLHAFRAHGPLAIQLAYVSTGTILGAIVLAVLLGLAAKNVEDVLYYSGIVLFGIVLLAFVTRAAEVGFQVAVFKHGFDIGYFIFSVPFLVSVLRIEPQIGNPAVSRHL